MMRISLAMVVALAGCGQAAGNGYAGQPLGVVQGQVSNAQSLSTPGRVDLSLGWAGFRGSYRTITSQHTTVTPVFPASFRIELNEVPPADALSEVLDSSGAVIGHLAYGFVMAYSDENANRVMDLPGPDNGWVGDTLLGASMSTVIYLEGRTDDPTVGSRTGFMQLATPCSAEEELAAWMDFLGHTTSTSAASPPQCVPGIVPLDTPVTVPLTAGAQLPTGLCFNLFDMLPAEQVTVFTPTCDADRRGFQGGFCMAETAPWAAVCFDHGCWRPHVTLDAGATPPPWWPCRP